MPGTVRRPLVTAAALATVIALGLPAAVRGEESDRRPVGGLAFLDEIELTVVNLTVMVTDKNGHAVTTLTADDFEVTQDGERKPITNFQLFTEESFRPGREPAVSSGAPPTASDDVAAPADLRPVFLAVYVDHDNLDPPDRNRILTQVRAFITDNLRPPVQMMVISRQREPKILQDFTSEPELVLDALRGVRRETGGRSTFDQDRRKLLEDMQRYRQDGGGTSVNSPSRMLAQVIGLAEEESNRLSFSLGSLREVVTMLSGLPGKKGILYVSNGLPMTPVLELFYAYANAYNEQGTVTMASRYNQSRAYRSLVAAANAQDVTLYTLDASGLSATGIAGPEHSTALDPVAASIGRGNYTDSLRYLADGTGGIAIVNTNDVTPGLGRIQQDFFTYYSIGYPLAPSGSDTVHEVRVRLPNHPDHTLRYRQRFVEKSLETQVQDRVVTGLLFPLEDNPMLLEVVTGQPAPALVDRWMVPLTASFPLAAVALLPEGSDLVGRLVMFVAARDSEGKQSDLVRQEHEVRVSATSYDEAQDQRYVLEMSLLMEQGSHTVAIGLLDPITRQASYRTVRARVPAGS